MCIRFFFFKCKSASLAQRTGIRESLFHIFERYPSRYWKPIKEHCRKHAFCSARPWSTNSMRLPALPPRPRPRPPPPCPRPPPLAPPAAPLPPPLMERPCMAVAALATTTSPPPPGCWCALPLERPRPRPRNVSLEDILSYGQTQSEALVTLRCKINQFYTVV